MRLFSLRPLLALCAIVAAVAFIAPDADARGGRGGSFGSRGTQTHSAPPTTTTAPNAAKPMERSMTQQPSTAARQSSSAPQTSGAGGFFSRPGFMGGLFAGFLGAGLFGMLMGHGFGGGLGGFASILGLVLQVGIIALVAYLVWTWWQRRQQPATAAGPMLRDYNAGSSGPSAGFFGGGGSGVSAAPAAARAAGTDEVGLNPDDFNNFERMLSEVQAAYGKEDLGALRGLVTPEMVSYYAEELADNASRGVVNHVSGVKLEQGDLAEAWREGDTEYASVAMRYALDDTIVDRASGRVVESLPGEATEVWTFMRVRGGRWLVSAVQQA